MSAPGQDRDAEFESLFQVVLPPRPYPGLRPFDKAEWPIFFGRERMVDAVLARLIEQRVLLVHGDSGCGKSSLIRAGVLPRLEQEGARSGLRWRTCWAVPGDAPLWNLAQALGSLVPGTSPEQVDAHTLEIRRILNFGSGAPAALAELLGTGSQDNLCILFDQFEELFAHARRHGSDEASLLTRFLVSLFAEPPAGLYAVLTMRSEFLGACARFSGLAEMVNASQYLLPNMDHQDLLRAIREPAQLYGGEISSELAERLIAEGGGKQDQLPLIQHGLMRLHQAVVTVTTVATDSSWKLGLEHYRHQGGLAALLSNHADEVMAQAQAALPEGPLPEERDSRLVEDLFRALTEINAEGQALRRPQTLARLVAVTGSDEAAVRGVVDAFRADGVSFLRPHGTEPLDDQDLIDVSHEALIRSWDRLAAPLDGWLAREFRNGLVWRSLLVQADSFERDSTNVLGATTTAERERWLGRRNAAWAERYGGGWERVVALLTASAAARDREAERQHAAARRERRLKVLYPATAFLIFLLAALAWLASQAVLRAQDAETQAVIAEEARREAEEARRKSDQLARKATESAAALEQVIADLRQSTAALPEESILKRGVEEAQLKLQAQVFNLEGSAVRTRLDPRLYVHIVSEQQRPAAVRLEQALESMPSFRIIVPGIERVQVNVSRSELRCFRTAECEAEGRRLAEAVNGLLATPIPLVDLSASYPNAKIRPLHFELWFAAGEIPLKPEVASPPESTE